MCETSFDADLPEEFDLDATPEVIGQILAGDFLAVSCPSCGARLKPELRVRLVSKKSGMDLVALPELERISLYRGAAQLPKGSEALVGYPELFERARDDRGRARSRGSGNHQVLAFAEGRGAGARCGHQGGLCRQEGGQTDLPPHRPSGRRGGGAPRRSGDLRQDDRGEGAQLSRAALQQDIQGALSIDQDTRGRRTRLNRGRGWRGPCRSPRRPPP